MSKRDEWLLRVKRDELAEGVESKIEHHSGRLDFWRNEEQQAHDAVRDSGVQVHSYRQSAGERHDVVIDPTLATRLTECQQKIEQHRYQLDEYTEWHSALERADEERMLELDFEDWLFFFFGKSSYLKHQRW